MPGSQEMVGASAVAEPRVFRVDLDAIDATTAWELRPALLRAVYDDSRELLVDLGRVSFIDSTGLGMLVGVLKEARSMSGDMRLINAGREVRRILQVTGLEAIFAQPPAANSSEPA